MNAGRNQGPLPKACGGLALIWVGVLGGLFLIEFPARFGSSVASYAATLDIGRLVFQRLSIAELGFCLLMVGLSLIGQRSRWHWLGVAGLLGIVATQSQWLLPELSVRSLTIVSGSSLPPSDSHRLYGVLEIVKITILLAIALTAGKTGSSQQAP